MLKNTHKLVHTEAWGKCMPRGTGVHRGPSHKVILAPEALCTEWSITEWMRGDPHSPKRALSPACEGMRQGTQAIGPQSLEREIPEPGSRLAGGLL